MGTSGKSLFNSLSLLLNKITTTVLCITGAALDYRNMTGMSQSPNLPAALLAAGVTMNIILNLFATGFIVTRLICHQRMLRRTFAMPPGNHSRKAVWMLLESAAINIPITVVVVVNIATLSVYGDFLMPVVVPGQSFASVLVMYQIALGKAVGEGSRLSQDYAKI
ncbi:hypothetical protein D9756_003588 [Leucocoprinus leucothites]|uniref:Uncharacterized protein n=1 Tax=Leucocoprinus leucothites TaxID=201217 RepID=A0A8H5LJG5_9AGAR|nr:hypothetical protein D9756_003588 [Leucoagaricus leucothites]